MRVNEFFEITDVAGEYLAIPIGNDANSINGVVVLNEASAFLLKQMKAPKSKADLVDLLISEYEVDFTNAKKDIDELIEKLIKIGLVME